MERRAFHLTVIYGLWGIISAGLGIPAALYLLIPGRTRAGGEWAEAGDIAGLKPNEPEELVFRRTRYDGWKVTSEKMSAWVVKTAADQVVAFAPQCTHLGCGYRWDEQRRNFLCPCHNSAFDIDGKVLSGPAPRPLDRFDVQIKGTELLLGPIRTSEA
jgi:menaquinol-cytochrome c reductase iron-sulfur subunit